MKKFTPKFLALWLLVFSSMIYAATDHTNITIEITKPVFLNLIGSVVGVERYLDADDIRPSPKKNSPKPIVSLGTLGLEASLIGSCTLDFASLNGFTLKHESGNQTFTDYQLIYTPVPSGTTHTFAVNTSITLPCNTTPVNLDFQAVGNIKNKIKAGIYSDILTVTVTNPE